MKDVFGGAGVSLATTCRCITAAGGLAVAFAPAPTMLLCTGATAKLRCTSAACICCALTCTLEAATGRAFTNVSCETTVTPFVTCWFTYVMLLTVVFLLMIVVL